MNNQNHTESCIKPNVSVPNARFLHPKTKEAGGKIAETVMNTFKYMQAVAMCEHSSLGFRRDFLEIKSSSEGGLLVDALTPDDYAGSLFDWTGWAIERTSEPINGPQLVAHMVLLIRSKNTIDILLLSFVEVCLATHIKTFERGAWEEDLARWISSSGEESLPSWAFDEPDATPQPQYLTE